MPSYITTDSAGNITAHADWPFPGSTCVDFDVVRGYDGGLYAQGKEPKKSVAELFASLRAMRDVRLAETDKYLLPDYPISAENLAQVKAYRAGLRVLPEQTGAPWDGGGEATPWPTKPEI